MSNSSRAIGQPSAPRRFGLVGCVKEKASHPAPARDLYRSTLFRGRRMFVERSCDQWWILSAKHGLVDPSDTIAPYDVTLKGASRAERRRWSQAVLQSIKTRVRPSPGDIFEIHAGADYRDYGLTAGLKALHCRVDVPTAGMSMGGQLSFYKQAAETNRG